MKKVFISTLVLSAVMASCSQSELDDQGNLGGVNNPSAIHFAASTTRAAINNLDALKASPDGFVVYGSKGASASA